MKQQGRCRGISHSGEEYALLLEGFGERDSIKARETVMKEDQIKSLCNLALKINEEAFAGEDFDIAYHGLVAAIHCAQRLEDIALLRTLANLAWEQLKYIDTNRPDYHHSTHSAQTRQNVSIFETAARMTEIKIKIIERKKRGTGNIP